MSRHASGSCPPTPRNTISPGEHKMILNERSTWPSMAKKKNTVWDVLHVTDTVTQEIDIVFVQYCVATDRPFM